MEYIRVMSCVDQFLFLLFFKPVLKKGKNWKSLKKTNKLACWAKGWWDKGGGEEMGIGGKSINKRKGGGEWIRWAVSVELMGGWFLIREHLCNRSHPSWYPPSVKEASSCDGTPAAWLPHRLVFSTCSISQILSVRPFACLLSFLGCVLVFT